MTARILRFHWGHTTRPDSEVQPFKWYTQKQEVVQNAYTCDPQVQVGATAILGMRKLRPAFERTGLTPGSTSYIYVFWQASSSRQLKVMSCLNRLKLNSIEANTHKNYVSV